MRGCSVERSGSFSLIPFWLNLFTGRGKVGEGELAEVLSEGVGEFEEI